MIGHTVEVDTRFEIDGYLAHYFGGWGLTSPKEGNNPTPKNKNWKTSSASP